MNREKRLQQKIDKRHITAMSIYAIKNVPGTDSTTLNKFLELVNVTGSHDWLSTQQLCDKMEVMIRYVPDTKVQSLLILAELLNVPFPEKFKSGRSTVDS